MDFRSVDGLAGACEGVDSIVHLAASNEIESLANPELATLINTVGTIRLIRAAEAACVTRFLYFSTAHVYGAPLVGTLTENVLPRPTHPYAISKRGGEDFLLAAHHRGAFAGTVVRLSNAFGWPVDSEIRRWTLIVNDLCRQAVIGRKLTLRSSGLQRRDFVTIADVCRAVEHLLALPTDKLGDGLFNLGGENPMRILEMAELIARRCTAVLGFRPDILHKGPAPDELSPEFEYRIDKLKSTGFNLQSDIEAEIDETLRICDTFFRISRL
jgi:UDP-glucose 4-epimerase